MNLLRLTTITALAAIAFPAGALAQALDPEDFAGKLSQMMQTLAAVEITFNSATVDGDTIILGDWNIPALGSSRGADILDRTFTFTGVTQTRDGGYRAEQAMIDDIDFTDDGVNLVVRNIVFNNVLVSGDPANDPLSSMKIYQSASVGPISVDIKGANVFRIDNIGVTSIFNDDQSAIEGSYEVSGIYSDLSQIDDPEAQAQLASFDISEINARMDGAFSRDLSDGRMVVEESSVTIDNIGKLDITFDISGYDLESIQQLQQAGKDLAGIEPGSPEYKARGLQTVMGLVTKLSLNEFAVRFDDDSITAKALAMMSERAGITDKQMIVGLAAMIPVKLAGMVPPDLIEQVVAAMTDFLKNPQSIEVSSKPEVALAFLSLMGAAKDPAALIDLLNLSVVANQAAE